VDVCERIRDFDRAAQWCARVKDLAYLALGCVQLLGLSRHRQLSGAGQVGEQHRDELALFCGRHGASTKTNVGVQPGPLRSMFTTSAASAMVVTVAPSRRARGKTVSRTDRRGVTGTIPG
jgi:hypothetical protein